MEVPDIRAEARFEVYQSDATATPGAKRSTQRPKLEKGARASARSVAPTVIASAVRAGDSSHALRLWFPADTTYVSPDATERRTAASSVASGGPSMLMFTTAGRTACAVTQSTPAMMR